MTRKGENNREASFLSSQDGGDQVDEPSIKDLSKGTESRTSKVVTKGQGRWLTGPVPAKSKDPICSKVSEYEKKSGRFSLFACRSSDSAYSKDRMIDTSMRSFQRW